MTRFAEKKSINTRLTMFIGSTMSSFYFVARNVRLNLRAIAKNIWTGQEGLRLRQISAGLRKKGGEI